MDAFNLSYVAVCMLSFLGSIFMIISSSFMIRASKNKRSKMPKILILQLSIADMGVALSVLANAFGAYKSFTGCIVTEIFAQIFPYASIFWNSVISVHLMITIVFEYHRRTARFLSLYTFISWGIPLFLLLGLLGTHSLGGMDVCWQGEDVRDDNGTMFTTLYGILLALFACNVISTIMVRRKVHSVARATASLSANGGLNMSSVDRKLYTFQAVFCIIWIIPVTMRVVYYLTTGGINYTLEAIQAICIASMGFLDFVVFCDKKHGWRFWRSLTDNGQDIPRGFRARLIEEEGEEMGGREMEETRFSFNAPKSQLKQPLI